MTEDAKKEYLNRYLELQDYLQAAYIDIFCLEEIEKYNESIRKDGRALLESSFNVLGHICELLKADLGLTIWKLFFDDDTKANSIKTLKGFLRREFDNSIADSLPKLRLPENLDEPSKQLQLLRNKYLAHADYEKSGASVELFDLKRIVEELRRMLNAMCFKQIDNSVTETTDNNLKAIQFNVSFGLGLMIRRSTFPVDNQQSKNQ